MDARQQRLEISQRTFDSVKNSLRLINDSEHTANATLEELSEQREALQRAENNLDTVNTLTRATQKHLKSMRSMFSGLFGGSSNVPRIEAAPPEPLASVDKFTPPTSSISSSSTSSSNQPRIVAPLDDALSATSNRASQVARKLDPRRDETLNEGLDELGGGLSRLKSMALMLGNEIEDQNSMLERIGQKAERADDTIKHQNRQMERLLKS